MREKEKRECCITMNGVTKEEQRQYVKYTKNYHVQ